MKVTERKYLNRYSKLIGYQISDLIEKWFISEKLGQDFWKIPSEEYYKTNQQKYYATINIGVNFYELNYDNCIGFLEMLPNCLKY